VDLVGIGTILEWPNSPVAILQLLQEQEPSGSGNIDGRSKVDELLTPVVLPRMPELPSLQQ
jgi:hypothetical protein